jgi:hypothetical protein
LYNKNIEGYKNMKKIYLAILALLISFGIAGIVPAQAEEQRAIAIIDASFDARLIGGDVLEVCVVSRAVCSSRALPRNASQHRAYNHGTIMADIIRSQNPDAKIILITAGTTKTGVVNTVNFNEALKWIDSNNEAYNIKSVSFSYNAGVGATCKPKATGVNVNTLHSEIVSIISVLKSEGTLIYAASGNYQSGNNIDYPACINDVVAVGSNLYRGSQARSDIIFSGFTYTSNVLKSSRTSLQDSFAIDATGPHNVRVGNTTSVATAMVAANN